MNISRHSFGVNIQKWNCQSVACFESIFSFSAVLILMEDNQGGPWFLFLNEISGSQFLFVTGPCLPCLGAVRL